MSEENEDSKQSEIERDIERAYNEDWNGYADVQCSKCGQEYRVEPDASFECHEDGCDGRVQSTLMKLGMF